MVQYTAVNNGYLENRCRNYPLVQSELVFWFITIRIMKIERNCCGTQIDVKNFLLTL